MQIFATITSPVFSKLAIAITGYVVAYLPQDERLFETLRKMHEHKPFKLVFSPEGSGFYRETARRELAEAVDSVVSKGLLDFLASPPTIHWARFSPSWEEYIFPPHSRNLP